MTHQELVDLSNLLAERERVATELQTTTDRDPIAAWARRKLEWEGVLAPRPGRPTPPKPTHRPWYPRYRPVGPGSTPND